MPRIPKNNLREQMLKLNYNPNLVKITAPVINYVPPPQPPVQQPAKIENQPQQPTTATFQPPPIVNIDDWSDFEED